MARDFKLFMPPFDATADYVVIRPFTFRGKTVERGSPFDKTMVTHRTLRQMCEARQLAKVVGTGEPLKVRQPLRSDLIYKQRIGVDKKTGRFTYGLFRDGIRVLSDVVSLDGSEVEVQPELSPPNVPRGRSAIAAKVRKRGSKHTPDTTVFVNEPAATVSEAPPPIPAPIARRQRRE